MICFFSQDVLPLLSLVKHFIDERQAFKNNTRECPVGDLQWECGENLLDEGELYPSRLVQGRRRISSIAAFQREIGSGEQEWGCD